MSILKFIGSAITFFIFLTMAYLILGIAALFEFLKGILELF